MAPADSWRGQAEEHRLAHVPASGARARALLQDFCAAHEVAPIHAQEGVIVLGELVSNALDHGSALPDGSIEICFTVEADALRLVVRDGGGSTRPEVVAPEQRLERGRGLAMVDALCRDWRVERVRGTRVEAVLAMDTASHPPARA